MLPFTFKPGIDLTLGGIVLVLGYVASIYLFVFAMISFISWTYDHALARGIIAVAFTLLLGAFIRHREVHYG